MKHSAKMLVSRAGGQKRLHSSLKGSAEDIFSMPRPIFAPPPKTLKVSAMYVTLPPCTLAIIHFGFEKYVVNASSSFFAENTHGWHSGTAARDLGLIRASQAV